MITVMLVDDQEMIRTGLKVIVDAHPDMDVVAEAADGMSALMQLRRVDVDVVLLDLNMPGIDGVETTRRIRTEHDGPRPRILVLTTFDQDENVLAALRAGADGFLGKGAGPAELTDGIRRTAQGGRVLSQNAIEAVVGHVTSPPIEPADPEVAERFSELTPRELEIVEQIADGLSNAEIGRIMFISPYTVKTHANRAMVKVGARDRAQLVSLAVRAGIRGTR
ncbi:response regulator [Rhodococcus sp. NPDC003318]|uniref:response regulator n=1 Tax=Rhodococcus sp. NPDC003318 TaxID=3364503 RepID=UPI0036D01E8A